MKDQHSTRAQPSTPKRWGLHVGIPVLILMAAAHGSGPGGVIELSRHAITSGGSTEATAGDFTLSGSMGQPLPGEMVGGSFTMSGGFWIQTPPGDCNFDGVTDSQELAELNGCLAGPASPAVAECRCFDLDHDEDVDLYDLAGFQRQVRGQ